MTDTRIRDQPGDSVMPLAAIIRRDGGMPTTNPRRERMVRFAAAALALAATLLGLSARGAEIVLLDFWSPNCGPCMQMKPTIHSLEQADYPIRQVDTTREPQLARQYNVTRHSLLRDARRRPGSRPRRRRHQQRTAAAMFQKAKDEVVRHARRRGQSPDPARLQSVSRPNPSAGPRHGSTVSLRPAGPAMSAAVRTAASGRQPVRARNRFRPA